MKYKSYFIASITMLALLLIPTQSAFAVLASPVGGGTSPTSGSSSGSKSPTTAPIPAGCPGSSSTTAKPTPAQLKACAAIPAGCPGSTNTPAANSSTPTNCPYEEYSAVPDPAVLNGSGNGGPLFANYINPFVTFLSASVGIVVVISIIYGAIQYSSAGGDPQKVAAARARIRNSIVALVAYLFLWAFLQWLLPGGIG